MQIVPAFLAMFSILLPAKLWFAPNEPLMINVKADAPLSLVLTTFDGKKVDAKGSIDVSSGGDKPVAVDLRQIYPAISNPDTYLLFAVPQGKPATEFVGTPLVIEVLADKTPGAPAGASVIRVEALRYAVMTTDKGLITMVFYYDVAPNTVDSFLRLGSEGFFNGLTFHRIVPGFVIQGGDPRGDGSGGPGYNVDAEFNDRPHEEGALSMARHGDPDESSGVMPRAEFANSAGSQFFVCLDYKNTKQLDRRYTVFGKVVDGMDAVKQIAATPIADASTGRPETPQVIQKVEVFSVVPGKNPYAAMINIGGSITTGTTPKPGSP
jgi:peptidyl-prolyl cis-trans isomerase B (cyclophilin B)